MPAPQSAKGSIRARKLRERQLVVGCSAITYFMACGGSDPSTVVDPNPGGAANDSSADARGHLIVVTERESPDALLQYLHVLDAWPESGELDYAAAIELGELVDVQALGDAVFVYQPDDARVRKLVIAPDGAVASDQTISFAAYGVGFAGDMVYVSAERADFVDEATGQIVSWNPRAMEVIGAAPIAVEALTRDRLPAQISRGVALEGRGFVAASWRDWDTLVYRDAAALGVFDANTAQPELSIVEDDRCASTLITPFDGGDGFVYLVSDAAFGFDALANPNRTQKTLCVLRIQPGAGQFDPGFFVDLGAALNSPGFYTAHPMKEGKLLVNVWAHDVEVDTVADPSETSWYWNYPPFFEFAIIDLATATSTPVTGIPRAAVQRSITLRVDNDNFVQTYRDDLGSDLLRVDTDGTVTRVLSNPENTDVQYLGRVGG